MPRSSGRPFLTEIAKLKLLFRLADLSFLARASKLLNPYIRHYLTPGINALTPKDIREILWCGLHVKCTQCGQGKPYQGWHLLNERCVHCGCEFQNREGNCWAFMYLSTVFFTGLFILTILLTRPPTIFIGQVIVVVSALAITGITLLYRKGVALAIDYLVDNKVDRQDDRLGGSQTPDSRPPTPDASQ